MYVLGKHPDVQDRILEELDEQIPKFGVVKLSVQMLSNLDYLERTIKEVLRLYPSVPFIGRQIYEPLTIGKIIYKNFKTKYSISIYLSKNFPTSNFVSIVIVHKIYK